MSEIYQVRYQRQSWTRAPRTKLFRRRKAAEKFMDFLRTGEPLSVLELVPGVITRGQLEDTPPVSPAKARFDRVSAPSAAEAAEFLMNAYPGGLIDLMLPAMSDYAWEEVAFGALLGWETCGRVVRVEVDGEQHWAFGSARPA